MSSRCDMTDLIVESCAHCRHPAERPFNPGDLAHGQPFDARYAGHCGNESCGRWFREGDSIARLEDDPTVYICERCQT